MPKPEQPEISESKSLVMRKGVVIAFIRRLITVMIMNDSSSNHIILTNMVVITLVI